MADLLVDSDFPVERFDVEAGAVEIPEGLIAEAERLDDDIELYAASLGPSQQ